MISSMGGKNDYIHIRSDSELKAALKKAAQRADRKDADQARYLLKIALGLITESDDRDVFERVKQHGDPHSSHPLRRPQSA